MKIHKLDFLMIPNAHFLVCCGNDVNIAFLIFCEA